MQQIKFVLRKKNRQDKKYMYNKNVKQNSNSKLHYLNKNSSVSILYLRLQNQTSLYSQFDWSVFSTKLLRLVKTAIGALKFYVLFNFCFSVPYRDSPVIIFLANMSEITKNTIGMSDVQIHRRLVPNRDNWFYTV